MAENTAHIRLVEGIQMVGESGSGHAIVMDGPPEAGGRGMGVRPMELLLIGMGGCTSIDVLNILRKGRHRVTDCETVLSGVRADSEPKVYTGIKVHFRITGKDIPAKAVERAIKLSEETYCSASIMLGKTAAIETSYEIISDDQPEP